MVGEANHIETPSAPTSETPHLTEAYYKAHKSYALASAILIAWELIGITFETQPLENVKVTLKSPDAAPFVLLALVFYFAFRFSVEWLQCDRRRRGFLQSQIDFGISHILAATAVGIYVVQKFLSIQVFQYLGVLGVYPIAARLVAFGSGAGGAMWHRMRPYNHMMIFRVLKKRFLLTSIAMALTTVAVIAISWMLGVRIVETVVGAIVGFVVGLVSVRIIGRRPPPEWSEANVFANPPPRA